MFIRQFQRYTRFPRYLAVLLFVVIALVPPVSVWTLERARLAESLETESRMISVTASRFIGRYQGYWSFAADRLAFVVNDVMPQGRLLAFTDRDGDLVLELGDPQPWPVMTRSQPLYGREGVTGTLTLRGTLMPVLRKTVFVFFGALAAALLVTLPVWRRVLLVMTEAAGQVQESRERFKRLTELSNDGYWEMDAKLRFTAMSTGMVLIGRTLGVSVGDTLRHVPFTGEFGSREGLLEALRKRARFNREQIRVGSGRAASWFLFSGEPLFDAAGTFLGYHGTATDITASKRAEAAILEAKSEAEAANRAKSVFLANMSHEMRTPLNGVLGMLRLLKTTGPDSEQGEYLQAAGKAVRRLNHLISDILDISRIEADKMALADNPVQILAVRQFILELFDLAAREKGLTLEFTVDKELPPVVRGDEARLQQILLNLVGNAVKFTNHGQVRVHASLLPLRKGDGIRILFTVSDTGIGIADDQLPDIFDPFVQVERQYTRRYQGVGLGLAITSRLVNLFGGGLSVDSEPGRGTTFYLSLPFGHSDEQPRTESADDPEMLQAARPLRVLLVEDEAVNVIAGQRLLEKSGHAVTTARNGREAIDALAAGEFDVVLMDIQMPDMNGMEATRAIRNGAAGESGKNVPIIALTAYAMTGDRDRFLAEGMDDYLTKPMEMEALQRILNWAAGRLGAPEA